MTNMLTDGEIKAMATLAESITASLECDINGTGIPCRTDREEALKAMAKYLRINGYAVARQSTLNQALNVLKSLDTFATDYDIDQRAEDDINDDRESETRTLAEIAGRATAVQQELELTMEEN